MFLVLGDTALVFMTNPGFALTYDGANQPNGVVPGKNPIANFFMLYPFATWLSPTNMTMQSYFYYRYIIILGVICNSIATLGYEKFFISWYTDRCDKQEKLKKDKEFEARMVKPSV